MKRTRSIALALVCTAALAACEQNPSEPALEIAQATEWSGADLAAAANSETRSAPSLRHLVRRALAKVKHEQGEDAARALAANLVQLHQEARAAHEAGDRETVRAKRQAAHLESARIVTRVFGTTPAERATAALGAAVAKIDERIAAAEAEGRDVTRAKQLASRLATLHAEASEALTAGNPALALDRAARGLEVLQRLQHARQRR